MFGKKHVVLLVADSLRQDAVEDADVPYLAARGLRFTQARSGGSWTGSATATMFTGLMPHEHGIDARSRGVVPSNIPTLAEILRYHGYGTHQVTANVVTTSPFGLDRGFDTVDKVWLRMHERSRYWENALVLVSKPRLRKTILGRLQGKSFIDRQIGEDVAASRVWFRDSAQEVFQGAHRLLKEHRAAGTPAFIFMNLMESHFPYHIGPELSSLSYSYAEAVNEYLGLFKLLNQTWLKRGEMDISPTVLAQLRRRQKVAWQRLAPLVDQFVEEVDRHGDTIFVFTSDHGDCFGEDGSAYHFGNVTDGGNRVPLYILDPDEVGGRAVNVPVSARHLFDTVLSSAVRDSRGVVNLTREPERSTVVLESSWYNADGHTAPRYRHDQFCFVEGDSRFMHRGNSWYVAPVTTSKAEEPWQTLSDGYVPLYGIADKERRASLHRAFEGFRQFSAANTP